MKSRYLDKMVVLLLFFCFYATAQEPHIGYVFPAGGKAGSTVMVVIGGQNLDKTKHIRISCEGISESITGIIPHKPRSKSDIVDEQQNDQIADKVAATITIDKKTKPGIYDLRLETDDGFSNRIFFEVGQFAEIKESPEKSSLNNPTEIPEMPTVLNGQIMPGEKDYFRFFALKGDTIVIETKARVLDPYLADAVPGWFQAVVTLRDCNGKEVAYNDDFKTSPDPVIIYPVAASGDYTLEIKDAIYRGREDFIYRIAVGKIPFVTAIYPLGGEKGKKTKLSLSGANLETYHVDVVIPDNAPDRLSLRFAGKQKMVSNEILFSTGSNPEISLHASNTTIATAKPIPTGVCVNNSFDLQGDEHWYSVSGDKGDRISISLMSHRLGVPLDADLSIFDENKTRLAYNDDVYDRSEGLETFHADPSLNFTFSNKQTIFLRVRDLEYNPNEKLAYRLSIEKPVPDFDLRLVPSNLIIPQGGTASFTIIALRRNNFSGPITLTVENIPETFLLSPSTIIEGTDQLRMTITAPKNASKRIKTIVVKGTAVYQGNKIVKTAMPAEDLMQAFLYMQLLPTSEFLASVTDPQPFSVQLLNIKPNQQISKGGKIEVVVEVDRMSGFNSPVQLVLDNPPKGVKMKPVTVPAGEHSATVEIEENFSKPGMKLTLVISGNARIGKNKKATIIRAISPVFNIETID